MGLLSFLKGKSVDYKQLVTEGAIILDVRTPGEFKQGHIKGSINAPLQELDKHLNKLDKSKTIITCCASGMRSASAKAILKGKGFANVHNGGGWASLRGRI